MKSTSKITAFLTILAILVFLTLIVRILNYPKEKISANSIRSIQLGDSLEMVLLTLGSPKEYYVETFTSHKIGCKNPKGNISGKFKNISDLMRKISSQFNDTISCCSPDDKPHFSVTLTYTEPKYFLSHPMLWVHLDKNRRVYGVYAKDYTLFDDICIYNSSCLIADSTFESIYHQQEHHEIKEIFEEIF
jgi:hypothetical protein